jgi:hypothetical protein
MFDTALITTTEMHHCNQEDDERVHTIHSRHRQRTMHVHIHPSPPHTHTHTHTRRKVLAGRHHTITQINAYIIRKLIPTLHRQCLLQNRVKLPPPTHHSHTSTCWVANTDSTFFYSFMRSSGD